jgi:hypothetical protein
LTAAGLYVLFLFFIAVSFLGAVSATALGPTMIRPLLALACCLAAAGCQSDVPEETYDVSHPFDRALAEPSRAGSPAARAYTHLSSFIARVKTTREAIDDLGKLRIECMESGALLRCTYSRFHRVTGKALVQLWQVEFSASINFDRSSANVRRVCFSFRVVSPPESERIAYAPDCYPE